MQNRLNRRTLVKGMGAGVALGAIGMPAIVRAQEAVRIGYLHTVAVDGQMWLADHMGLWKERVLRRNSSSSRPVSNCFRQ